MRIELNSTLCQVDKIAVGYKEEIIAEFDQQKRVLHLTAKKRLAVQTLPQLVDLCGAVSSILREICESDRCYMVVDLTKFSIETDLSKQYMEKISRIQSDFIYSDGLVRYGYEITRATIKIGYALAGEDDPQLFATKHEAMKYIDSLIASKGKSISSQKA